jgi:aldehyde dehydrogenase (NAD+)
MVLKPSEEAPYSAHLWAEILDEAGVPAGVFNLVDGTGAEAGAALSGHPDVDMVSFTGSTRAGVEVARAAAPTVKRVAQELGGKSPCIVLDDDNLAKNVVRCIRHVMNNSGQSCNAPTRLLVPRSRLNEAVEAACGAAEKTTVGDPRSGAHIGPVVNRVQWDKIQRLIRIGMEEGARLAAGGPDRPEGLEHGFYVRPTVFAGVNNAMTIAREEIFGPVAAILAYDDIDEAVAIANDTDYGLSAYVWGSDLEAVRAIAGRLRAGQVSLNGADDDLAPFGGYRMSGNGREGGDFGMAEFLEVKAVMGYAPVPA